MIFKFFGDSIKKSYLILLLTAIFCTAAWAQQDIPLRARDRKKDIALHTSLGTILLRLSDSTPLHRDNFIRLVKQHYYDSTLFHRVIPRFMIQGGDPNSRRAAPQQPLGNGGPAYTIPAEFRTSLFHKKGALAAARTSDEVNPERESSGSQFYIVQGQLFTEGALDTLEKFRLVDRRIPQDQRKVYTTVGGTPHLDQQYTVFGEVVGGLEVADRIAQTATSKGGDRDRPLEDIVIYTAELVKRKK